MFDENAVGDGKSEAKDPTILVQLPLVKEIASYVKPVGLLMLYISAEGAGYPSKTIAVAAERCSTT